MMNRQTLINGNTVLVPEYQPIKHERNKEKEEQKRAKLQELKKNRETRIKNKLKAIGSIVLIFTVGLALIYRYSTIYKMQNDLRNIKNEVVKIEKDNDNLNVELLKVSNIDYIKQAAEGKLKMVSAHKNQVIYSDLTKDNFSKHPDKNNIDTQAKFIERVKNMLF